MKFLKNEEITKSNETTTITFDQVNTSLQARIIAMTSQKSPTCKSKVELTIFLLRTIIKTITINDQELDPIVVSEKADLSDVETAKVFIGISSLVLDAIILSEEDKKKSLQPQSQNEKRKDVTSAPEVKEGILQENAEKTEPLNG